MNNESKDAYFWNVWRDILLTEYDSRLAAPGTKGYRVVSARKTFAAIFLQVKGFLVPAVDILPEIIRTVQEKDSLNSLKEYDDMAIMGQRRFKTISTGYSPVLKTGGTDYSYGCGCARN